jgi:hypothetical protein
VLGGGLDPLPVMMLLTTAVIASVAIELALHHRHEHTRAAAEPI